MKTLSILLLLVLAISAPAQTNKPPRLSPEQQAKADAMKKQIAEMNAEMKKITAAAQQRALERKARMATSPPAMLPREVMRSLPKNRPPIINTNLWYPGLGNDIKVIEATTPGASTNYSEAQKALTNRLDKKHRPGTLAAPDLAISTSLMCGLCASNHHQCGLPEPDDHSCNLQIANYQNPLSFSSMAWVFLPPRRSRRASSWCAIGKTFIAWISR